MFQVSANLFRIVQNFTSGEETRYYLGGVYIEPACKQGSRPGVVMVATDGHRMLVAYDRSGKANESAVIKLSKPTLTQCKGSNILEIADRDDDHADNGKHAMIREVSPFISITEPDDMPEFGKADPIATSANCRIDGTFPDYRRVVPDMPSEAVDAPDGTKFSLYGAAAFNGSYVASFGKISGELYGHYGETSRRRNGSRGKSNGQIRIVSAYSNAPALVFFPDIEDAFGVIMPMRAVAKHRLPVWFKPLLPAVVAAKAETELEKVKIPCTPIRERERVLRKAA